MTVPATLQLFYLELVALILMCPCGLCVSITDRLSFLVCVFESDYLQERAMASFDCPPN